MPRTVEMGDLITRAKLRADKENDDHISSAAWRSFFNDVYGADVYSVVAGTGGRYFEYKATVTTTGVAYVSEPSDHLSLMGVDYVDTSGRHWPLDPLEVQEEAFYVGAPAGSRAYYYTLVDDRLYLYPTPPTGQSYEVQYIPQPPDLTTFADDDCVDVVSPDGESCMIWGAAALAKIRASQDASIYLQKADMHRQALQLWACDRTLTESHRTIVKAEDVGRHGMDAADWRYR